MAWRTQVSATHRRRLRLSWTVWPKEGSAELRYGFCEESWNKWKEIQYLNRANIAKYPSKYRCKFAQQLAILGHSTCANIVSLFSASWGRTHLDTKNYLCGSLIENIWETPIQHTEYRCKISLSNEERATVGTTVQDGENNRKSLRSERYRKLQALRWHNA